MPVDLATLKPGDVIVTMTPDVVGWLIRFRSRILGKPDLHNHVALFTHLDNTGRPRGLEGRPSGFGWANLDKYLNHPSTVANTDQPGRDDEQREKVVRGAVAMIGIPYDWQAIIAFAAGTARLPFLPREWPADGVPSHVVCSSAVDYLYESVSWASPGGLKRTRAVDPGDWTQFIEARAW